MQRVRDDAQHKIRNTQHATRNARHVLRIACCVFLLAACQVPGSVRPTVKIGLVAPFEGRYRYVGYDVIYAVRLALREANAAGGVGGYSVELVAYDDGADPAMAVEQVRKLAVDPEVVAAIGHFREDTTAAAWSTYDREGVPLVAPTALDLPSGCARADVCRFYRLGPGVDVLASALLQRLELSGHGRVAVLTDGGPLGAALQRDAQQNGLSISVVSPRDPDWLHDVQASGAEAVLCDAGPVAAGEAVAALRETGWQGAFLGGPELAAPDFVAVAGRAAEGAVFVTPWPFPADVPAFAAAAAFAAGAAFAAAYQSVSNGLPPGPFAAPAYEATWVLLDALQRDIAAHGTPTREGMTEALRDTDREGVLGLIRFDAGYSWGDAPLYSYRIGAKGVPAPIGQQ
jgi:ABC-type branched-subunit amino acid transport system substrate-binding protein